MGLAWASMIGGCFGKTLSLHRLFLRLPHDWTLTITKKQREKQRFEDVSPAKHGDFLLSCFRGSRINGTPSTKVVTAGPLFSDFVGPC